MKGRAFFNRRWMMWGVTSCHTREKNQGWIQMEGERMF